MAMRNTRVRKRLFIDSEVQGVLVCRLIANWIAALSLSVVGLFIIVLTKHGTGESLSFYASQMWADYSLAFVLMIASLPAITYDSIKLSHRFAGPHYALQMAVKRLAAGQPIRRITFRKGDFWTDVSNDINRVAEKLDLIQESDSELPGDGCDVVSDPSAIAETDPAAYAVDESATEEGSDEKETVEST